MWCRFFVQNRGISLLIPTFFSPETIYPNKYQSFKVYKIKTELFEEVFYLGSKDFSPCNPNFYIKVGIYEISLKAYQ